MATHKMPDGTTMKGTKASMAKGLYANMNARKKKGISRPKSKSTVSPAAYANMKAGFKEKESKKK